VTFTACVTPTLRLRIERWRRARELAGDQRAGSVTSLAAVIMASSGLFVHMALAWIAGFVLLVPLTLVYLILA
jgi:hypothetical protein